MLSFELLQCLALLAQTHAFQFSSKSLASLRQVPDLGNTLAQIASEHDITVLIKRLFAAFAANMDEAASADLHALLQALPLSDPLVRNWV
jgi:hypothetical protein